MASRFLLRKFSIRQFLIQDDDDGNDRGSDSDDDDCDDNSDGNGDDDDVGDGAADEHNARLWIEL